MYNRLKQLKYKKMKKGKLKKLNFKANSIKFGIIGLKAIESGIITSKQIESAQKAIILKIKKKGKMWIRIFPDIPITSKSVGVRMGKGKGQVSHWGTRVCGGNIIFEICSTDFNLIFAALKTGGSKLPIKTKIFN